MQMRNSHGVDMVRVRAWIRTRIGVNIGVGIGMVR